MKLEFERFMSPRSLLPALRSGCAQRMLPREYPTAGRPFTTTSGSGAGTAPTGPRPASLGGRARAGPEWRGDRPPGRQRDQGRRTRARLRRGQATLGKETPPASGHRRARTRRACSHAASLHDRDGARRLLTDEKRELPRMGLLWPDGAYTRDVREWAEEEQVTGGGAPPSGPAVVALRP